MLLAQRYAYGEIRRQVWMFDSFAGMAEPSEQDGGHAKWWKGRSLSGAADPDKQNFCKASFKAVTINARDLGLTEHVHIQEGWFADTIPKSKPAQIAVLRIDCDWYDPVKLVLEELAPRVSVGGPIILDDYGIWEGCTLATHEYLAAHRLPWAIRSADGNCGVFMIKTPETW
jgi:O-methyltransferase